MTDYPVKDEPLYDESNLPMQVYDNEKSDQIKPLILVKVTEPSSYILYICPKYRTCV